MRSLGDWQCKNEKITADRASDSGHLGSDNTWLLVGILESRTINELLTVMFAVAK